MKKIIYLFLVSLVLTIGCTGVKSTSSGIENEAYLNFVGVPSNYSEGVIVNIDDKSTFNAEVNKDFSDRPKGKVYAISNGTHIITVSYKNQVIYKQQIFISAQETKKITLP